MDTTTTTATKTNDTITLSIDRMSCGHCVNAVTKTLSAVPGVQVKSVVVGTAQIEAQDEAVVHQAAAALEAGGYPARVATADAPASGKVIGKVTGEVKGEVKGEISRGCCG